MSVQLVNRAQALQPGCDLWIFPEDLSVNLFRKFDWYLNFQLSRAQYHIAHTPATELKAICHENGIPTFNASPELPLPLMIPAEEQLPTKKVVQIKETRNKFEWVNSTHNIWQGLNCPSLRVFLPESLTFEEFKSCWPGPAKEEVFVVPIKK